MNTFSELYQWIQSQLSVTSDSTFFTLTRIKAEINNAYLWAGGLFPWPATMKAKTTSTISGQDYYDYPTTFRPDSVIRIEIDGKEYNPKLFTDFLDFRRDNPSSVERIFATFGSQYFIFPTPTANGIDNMDIWGQDVVPTLSQDADTTIFSTSYPDGNMAICKQALAVLKAKGNDKKSGQVEDSEAKDMLINIYSLIAKQQQKYQKLDNPMFNVPDLFR